MSTLSNAALHAMYESRMPRKEIISERPGIKVVRLSIPTGGSVPTHSSNADVIATVVRGSGAFMVEDRAIPLAPGVVVDMHPGQAHSIEAREALELIVVHAQVDGAAAAVTCGA